MERDRKLTLSCAISNSNAFGAPMLATSCDAACTCCTTFGGECRVSAGQFSYHGTSSTCNAPEKRTNETKVGGESSASLRSARC
jgi:hypothetical protein